MSTEGRECIVHDRKYLSKFHSNINQLRRNKEFHLSILQKLPKRCCSCHEQKGESLFDLDHLREICQEIKTSEELKVTKQSPLLIVKPVNRIPYMILEYPSILTPIQRIYKAGRFVGRKGRHLHLLERTLNIRINIVNNKTSKDLSKKLDEVQTQMKEKHSNNLFLLITMKNDSDDIDQIKESLENAWKQIDVTSKKGRTKIIFAHTSQPIQLTTILTDSRWKPKKKTAKDKYKSKTKDYNEEEGEVPPQPLVRPLSMPKEMVKPQRDKRR